MNEKLTPSHFVHFLVGAILAFAAFGKFVSFIQTSNISDAAFGTIELGVGLWLVSGFLTNVAHFVAVFMFSLFAGFSFVSILNGYESCDCFGGVLHLTPFVMFFFDLCICGLILVVNVAEVATAQDKLHIPFKIYFPLAFLCGVLASALAFEDSTAKMDVVKNNTKELLEIAENKCREELGTGSFIILFSRQGCKKCERFESESRNLPTHSSIKLIRITIGGHTARKLRLDTPVALWVEDALVAGVYFYDDF